MLRCCGEMSREFAHGILLLPLCLFDAVDGSSVDPATDGSSTTEGVSDSVLPPTYVAYPMLFIFVSLLIGLAVRLALERCKNHYGFRIPYSVVLLIFGGMLGGISWWQQRNEPASDKWTISLTMWTSMNPRLILFIFLPALIFEGSMSTDYYVFKQQLPGGLTLAFPAMILQCVLIAMVGLYTFPFGWGWTESLMFGAILSATDPVAVIALMKELGLLSDLRVLIEAESLLNDGAAIVVFELCHTILVHPASINTYVNKAFQLTLAAPALGSALFLACWWWLIKTDDPIQDTLVTVCTAYLAYFAAETNSISGVLAVLTIGVWMAGYGNTAIHTEHAQHMLHAVWTVMCYICDTIIFILAGAIVVQDGILNSNSFTQASDFGYAIALYIFLIFIRAFVVLLCYPVLRYTGYGLQARVCSPLKFWKCMFILTWGGLRGAVGLVLSMIVAQDRHLAEVVGERDPHFCQRVILFTGIIVVLTTLINAASLEKVIILLGLGGGTQTEEQLKKSAKRFLIRKHAVITRDFKNRQNYPNLANVDWSSVEQLVGPTAILHNAPVEDHEHEDSFEEEHWNQQHFLGRYLTSLRCSYSSQFMNGLLTPLAYRQLEQALKSAIDHASDTTNTALEGIVASFSSRGQKDNGEVVVQLDDLRFEWGWLQYEGFLGMPAWLHYLHTGLEKTSCLSSFVDKWVRNDHARRSKLLAARPLSPPRAPSHSLPLLPRCMQGESESSQGGLPTHHLLVLLA
jgi:NhaP-type Na+/H+ or K+/H+ antiporter